MAEYYPLLARALSAQPNATPDMRNGIYERARKALLGQLRAHDPPLPELDIDREVKALEEAIARLEAEHGGAPAARAPERVEQSARPGKDEAATRENGAPKQWSLAERAKAHRDALANGGKSAEAPGAMAVSAATNGKNAPAMFASKPQSRISGGEPGPEGAGHSNGGAPAVVPTPFQGPDEARAPIVLGETKPGPYPDRGPIPKDGLLRKFVRSRVEESVEPAGAEAEASAPEPAASVAEAPSDVADLAAARTARPRPLAPAVLPQQRPTALYWGLAAGFIVLVAAVALLAFLLRDSQTIDSLAKAPVTAQKAPNKIIDRIGVGPTRLSPSEPGVGTLASGPVTATPAPASATPAASASSSSAANAGAATSAGAAAGTPAPTQAAAPVEQRAALLVQSPSASDPQAIVTYVGTAIWRLETVSPGAGQPPALAVRAEIDVPNARFKATMLLEKNTDDSLPASHTIEVRFMPGPGSAIGDVKQIDTPQMRREESPAGDPLSGIPTPITTNYFLVGLTKGGPAEAHNLDLIKGAGWFDVPMLLANGKIAKITFEKGVAGEKDLDDALASWSK